MHCRTSDPQRNVMGAFVYITAGFNTTEEGSCSQQLKPSVNLWTTYSEDVPNSVSFFASLQQVIHACTYHAL